MVILYRSGGNHSNKLFLALHVEAFCIEHGIRYFNPSFGSMAQFYGIRRSVFDPVVCFFVALLSRLRVLKPLLFKNPDELQSYYRTILNRKVVFAKGWEFRAFDLTKKHREYFVRKYSLRSEYYRDNTLYRKLRDLDRDRYVVVGIHVRRGDYKVWENGKYYFSDDVYRKYMHSMSEQLRQISDKSIVFIIFSDEQINIEERDCVIASRNPWYVDHLLMSMCDYLVGPPSTFTQWASYIGRAKFLLFKDDSGTINLNDFRKSEG